MCLPASLILWAPCFLLVCAVQDGLFYIPTHRLASMAASATFTWQPDPPVSPSPAPGSKYVAFTLAAVQPRNLTFEEWYVPASMCNADDACMAMQGCLRGSG